MTSEWGCFVPMAEIQKWGCWFDGDEIVSIIEESKENAIEIFCEQECLPLLDFETQTRAFIAMVGQGIPVKMEDYYCDFDRFCELLEEKIYEEVGLDEPLIKMNRQEIERARIAYNNMMHDFYRMYMKQRDWNTFPKGEQVEIFVVDGQFSSWRNI